MAQWNKINWPALNRRAREIEADLWRGSPKQGDFTEKDPAAPIIPTDRATAQALMVWSDDGGSIA
jgi:hypothetical protein